MCPCQSSTASCSADALHTTVFCDVAYTQTALAAAEAAAAAIAVYRFNHSSSSILVFVVNCYLLALHGSYLAAAVPTAAIAAVLTVVPTVVPTVTVTRHQLMTWQT
jgi:hypothetical protein